MEEWFQALGFSSCAAGVLPAERQSKREHDELRAPPSAATRCPHQTQIRHSAARMILAHRFITGKTPRISFLSALLTVDFRQPLAP